MTNTDNAYILPGVVSRFNYNPMMFTGEAAGKAGTMYVNSGIVSVKNAAGTLQRMLLILLVSLMLVCTNLTPIQK